MHNMEVELVLTGPRAGQTIILNRHYFRRGVATIKVGPEAVDALLTYMGRAYQAYLQGSEELASAQQRDRATAERRRAENGVRSDLQANPASADRTPAPVQSSGDQSAGSVSEARALLGGEHAGGASGSEGVVPGRSGHEDAGLGNGMDAGQNFEPGIVTDSEALTGRIRVAISKLDAGTDEHWTDDGFPAVAAIAEALHNQNINRPMIEAAAPGFTRMQAHELAAL